MLYFGLDKNAEVDNVFLNKNQVGYTYFDKWVDNNSFQYKEETWPSIKICRDNSEQNPAVQTKTHKINAYYY